jgi:hypothetical protein
MRFGGVLVLVALASAPVAARAEDDGAGARAARPVVFDVEADLAFASRNLSVEVEGSDHQRTYTSPGFPEMGASLDFFPLALGGRRRLANGLGLTASFRRSLYLQTSGPTDTGGTIDIDTYEQVLFAALLFQVPLDTRPAGRTLRVAAGFERAEFVLDPTAMSMLRTEVQMPSMRYSSIVTSGRLDLPFDTPYLGWTLSLSVRAVLDVGEEARDMFGDDHPGVGLGASTGLFGWASPEGRGFHWSARLDLAQFGTRFSGEGFRAATDRTWRLLLIGGYRHG